MIKMTLKIPLKEIQTGKYNAQTTPFHRWEHIFVLVLKNNLKGITEILGSTTRNQVILYISFLDYKYINLDKIIYLIKIYIPSKKLFRKQIIVINNEIKCICTLNNIKPMVLENGEYLDFQKMLYLRKIGFVWEKINISVTFYNCLKSKEITINNSPKIN